MKSNPIKAAEYSDLLKDIKARIAEAQYAALRAVNKELISLYWDIGRLIVERQKNESWGKSVVERLATDLQTEFPGVGGFSASNLWRMRLFHELYAGNQKLAPLVRGPVNLKRLPPNVSSSANTKGDAFASFA